MSKIVDYISKIVNKAMQSITLDIKEQLKDIQTAVEKQNQKINENEKDRIRWEILDFANSCRNNRNHTKDEFVHIMTLNDKYILLLKETNDKNGIFDIEYEYISKLYKEKLENNTFLDSNLKED